MLDVKILGTGCANCRRLEALVREVVAQQGLDARIEDVRDVKSIMSYGVMSTPGLVVNGEVKAKGRVPSKQEIAQWLAPR